MNLKDFLAKKDGKNRKLYWALVLEPGWIQAGIWEVFEEKAEVTSISPPAAWETDEDFIGAVDTALSSAVQSLPEDVTEPSDTVFAVPGSWVSSGEIKEDYLEKIKKLCSDLSLNPAGFVVLPEAAAHLYKSEEGSPLSAVVVGVGKEEIEIAVFKLGNLLGTAGVARSVSLADDVTEGLSRFAGEEALPSRFILYDGKEGELEEARQSLLAVPWDDYEKIKFLHTPKIEILSPERKVLATALAGGSEIANVVAVLSKRQTPAGDDLAGPEDKKDLENIKLPEGDMSAEDLGFVVGEDVASKPATETPAQTEMPAKNEPEIVPPQPFEKPAVKNINLPGFLQKVKTKITSLLGKGPLKPNLGQTGGKKSLTFGLVFLLAIFLAGFLYWWFVPKATVTVYVSPRRFDETMTASIDTRASEPDFSRNILPGEIERIRVNGNKTASTTGVKTVGERAKGAVKIQNGTANNLNLPAGTVLVAANDLRFTIDSSASVSAALSPTTPGTANVEITASDIGAEYNIAKDETFRVGNFPKAEVDAVATTDLSGGSSRQISVISEEDQAQVEEELRRELAEKAKNDLLAGLSDEDVVIEEFSNISISSRSFSGRVGDEATDLKLDLEVEVSIPVVKRDNLIALANQVLEEKVPDGFVLRKDQISFDFERRTEEESEINLFVSANFLPEINTDEIAKQISGKNSSLAENYLTSIQGFSRAEIQLKPRFPGRLATLPRVVGNISIVVAAER